VLPPDGIEPEDILARFLVPLGYPWDTDVTKYYAAAASLPPPNRDRDRRAVPDAHTGSHNSPHCGDSDPVYAGVRPDEVPIETVTMTVAIRGRMGDYCDIARAVLVELRAVFELLRACAAQATVEEVEVRLRRAECFLRATEGVAAKLLPPDTRSLR
jgi:hypothetical protein